MASPEDVRNRLLEATANAKTMAGMRVAPNATTPLAWSAVSINPVIDYPADPKPWRPALQGAARLLLSACMVAMIIVAGGMVLWSHTVAAAVAVNPDVSRDVIVSPAPEPAPTMVPDADHQVVLPPSVPTMAPTVSPTVAPLAKPPVSPDDLYAELLHQGNISISADRAKSIRYGHNICAYLLTHTYEQTLAVVTHDFVIAPAYDGLDPVPLGKTRMHAATTAYCPQYQD
jgi:hypothetical protein